MGATDAIGVGVGIGVRSPPFPRTTALSRISTKTAMTPMTNIADARSSMCTAMSDAVCTRGGAAGSRFPRVPRPEVRRSPRLVALSLPRRSPVGAGPFAGSSAAANSASSPATSSPAASSSARPRHLPRWSPAAPRRRARRRPAGPPGARPARGRPAWSSCCVTPSMCAAGRRRTPGPRIPQAGAER